MLNVTMPSAYALFLSYMRRLLKIVSHLEWTYPDCWKLQRELDSVVRLRVQRRYWLLADDRGGPTFSRLTALVVSLPVSDTKLCRVTNANARVSSGPFVCVPCECRAPIVYSCNVSARLRGDGSDV